MGGKDCCKGTLESAIISDILYLFGQGNFIFIGEKLMSVTTVSQNECPIRLQSQQVIAVRRFVKIKPCT